MSKLLAYRASAGSGKTFTLTREFLLLLFKHEMSFKNILAVTFTNKACAEMKGRIIKQLYELSCGKQTPYAAIIKQEFDLQAQEIQDKARSILNQILHNYSFFFVETIDKFFQRIVKNFAKELGIYALQNIELDNNRILELTVKQLFIDIDQDQDLKVWLQEFISNQIDSGENYNVRRKILNIGREVFYENVATVLNTEKEFFDNKEHIQNIYKDYRKLVNDTDKQFVEIADKATKIIKHHGLEVTDFSYGNTGAINHFNKLRNGDYTPLSRVTEAIENPSKLMSAKSDKKAEILAAINDGLIQCLQESVELWKFIKADYTTALILLEYQFTFPVITKIHRKVLDYCRENNVHLLSNNNMMLRNIINDNPAPFLYEKIGTFLKHFMLDEFQDTSSLQWQNIKPLVDNSLAEGNKSLVVGDVKQSIYRWRNGDWTLLGKRIYDDYEGRIDSHSLQYNYRSSCNIIAFNNKVFDSCKQLLQTAIDTEMTDKSNLPETLQDVMNTAYSDVAQKTPEGMKKDGFVSVQFLAKDNYEDNISEKLPALIEQLQDRGFAPSDIAIILRGNKECKKVVSTLLDYKKSQGNAKYCYDVVSSEALELGKSPAIRIIINIIKASINDKDKIAKAAVIEEFFNTFSTELKLVRSNSYEELLERVGLRLNEKVSLFEKSEEIISKLGLATKEEIPYIKDFQDIILNHTIKSEGTIGSFLKWWTEKGSNISVKLPEGQNAIQVLTIHKSKGLEFKAVIIPYCTWDLTDYKNNVLWATSPKVPFPIHPIAFNAKLKDSHYSIEFQKEKIQQYIDNLNLLYVALTRAEQALYVFCQIPSTKSKDIKTVSGLLYEAVEKENDKCEMGTLQNNESTNQTFATGIACKYPCYGLSENVFFATHGKEFFEDFEKSGKRNQYGIVMHEILATIASLNDIDSSIEIAYIKGLINKEETQNIKAILTTSLNNEEAKNWFDGSTTLLSETTILLPNTASKRPDRIMIKDQTATVVDYKFTKQKSAEHRKQVSEYISLLQEMGYEAKGYLWYFVNNEIVEIVD